MSNTARNRNRSREQYRVWREAALKLVGRVCIGCGYNDLRALQIDHVEGGGSAERKSKKLNGYQYYQHIYNEVLSGEKSKYQTLCANCNRIKCIENHEVPHQLK